MKDNKINMLICKLAFAKEIVFKKWFIGFYYNFRNPIIGISFGFTSFEVYFLFLNILIALKVE